MVDEAAGGAELYSLTPDFSEAQDFSPFPDRTLACVVKSVKGFMSKGKDGKAPIPMVRFVWTITEDYEYTGGDGEKHNAKDRSLFRNFPASGVGTGFLKSCLAGHKYDPAKFRLPDSALELVGRKVAITTKQESFDGSATGDKINRPSAYRAL